MRLTATALLLVALSGLARAQECAVPEHAHASAIVVYGHDSGAEQTTVLTPTPDGAVQAVDAATGSQLWAFTAPEVAASTTSGDRITDLRVLRFDTDQDGTIDIAHGDRVWLYFGLRDAGPHYYALDISARLAPKVLWTASADTLEGLTSAWSTPTVARVRVSGAAQNGERFVLVFGGGERLFMVDAATGRSLWSTETERAMSARIAVLDTEGDGYADRMYSIDIGGELWRFDISNGKDKATLVTGSVIADLSGEGRAFFNAPDVALIQAQGREPYYNVAVGSGSRRLATASEAHDFFYTVRDKEPFRSRSYVEGDRDRPITADDLVDIGASAGGAAIPPDANGWKLDLKALGDDARVVGESVTAGGVVLFTTFRSGGNTVQSGSDSGECNVGSSRVYAVRVDNATPGLDLNDDGKLTADDFSATLPAGTPPAPVRIQLGRRSGEGYAGQPPGTSPTPPTGPTPGEPARAQCLVGSHVMSKCVGAKAVLRTFWRRPTVR